MFGRLGLFPSLFKLPSTLRQHDLQPSMRRATEVGAFNYGLIIFVESVIRFSPYMGMVRPPVHPPTPSPDLTGHLIHFVMFSLIGFGCGMVAGHIQPRNMVHHFAIGASMATYQRSVAELFTGLFS